MAIQCIKSLNNEKETVFTLAVLFFLKRYVDKQMLHVHND
jgi:hypothetical protein